MTRLNDWDRRLAAVTEKHMALPGAWGISDCWIATLDAIEAVTGKKLFGRLRRYRSEAAGYRAFRKAGFETLEDAFRSRFEPVGRLKAQRGDVGVVERQGQFSAGFFCSEGFAVKTLYGEGATVTSSQLVFLPVTAVAAAFKVGRN